MDSSVREWLNLQCHDTSPFHEFSSTIHIYKWLILPSTFRNTAEKQELPRSKLSPSKWKKKLLPSLVYTNSTILRRSKSTLTSNLKRKKAVKHNLFWLLSSLLKMKSRKISLTNGCFILGRKNIKPWDKKYILPYKSFRSKCEYWASLQKRIITFIKEISTSVRSYPMIHKILQSAEFAR